MYELEHFLWVRGKLQRGLVEFAGRGPFLMRTEFYPAVQGNCRWNLAKTRILVPLFTCTDDLFVQSIDVFYMDVYETLDQ
jgi:hypothetical protein